VNRISKTAVIWTTAATLVGFGCIVAAESPKKQARVTRIIREVNLLPSEAKPRPASLNDQVREGTAVRTGDESRSELTFLDLTITRLGANSIFSFNKAGRDVDLSSGSILLRVPKDSGGAIIRTSGVTAGIAGTTVILEAARSGRSKLIVLEGLSRLGLRKYRAQSKDVRAGQMLDVPSGATTLPDPVNVDLDRVMRTHPLIKDFSPLPSQPLIADEIQKQQRPALVSAPTRPPTSLGGMRLPPSAYPPTRPPSRPPQPPPPMTGGATGGTTTAPPPVTGEEAGGTTPVPPTGHSPRPGHGRPTVGQPGTVGTATQATPTPLPIITKTSSTPPPKLKPWQQAILGGGAQTQTQPTPTPRPRFRPVPGQLRKKPTPPPIR
jgi:hypothetical protein